MRKRGFTVVELVIVITIIGILVTLASVQLNSSITDARDNERKTDIETIALNLEKYYNSNSDRYPSTSELDTKQKILNIFQDIDERSLSSPDNTEISLEVASDKQPILTLPKDKYIYQPFDKDGELCEDSSDECRRFVIYSCLEIGNKVYSVESKNQ